MIGYGLCGRGTVGVVARDVPLAIPRVHDCIALFLGSDARHREQFAKHPGTYYVSAGWVEEKDPGPQRRAMGSDGDGECIDAGGTYTDVVLLDFETSRVRGKSKALTTPWDYTEGIRGALGGLDAGMLADVELVAVSTTLATNAIVEGRGQKTGLLVMPPCGWHEVSGFTHAPLAVIAGQLGIDGTEHEPVDPEQVRDAALAMLTRALEGRTDGYGVRIALDSPVIGVGAPADCFVPAAA